MRDFVKIGLGLGLLWYGVLRGAKGLVLKVRSFNFRDINLANGTVALNLNLLVKNPLFVGITIQGVYGDVYVQGVKVGVVDTTFNYYLSGGHTHILPVVVQLGVGELGQAAIENIMSGNIQTLRISFNGKVVAGKANVPVPLQLDLDYNDLVK